MRISTEPQKKPVMIDNVLPEIQTGNFTDKSLADSNGQGSMHVLVL